MRNTTTQSKQHTQTPQFEIESRYLTDRDLAAIYGVSRATIWRWTKQGHIKPPIKIAGSTRWRGADVVPQ